MRILFLIHKRDYPYRKWIKPHAPGFLTSGKLLIDTTFDYLSEVDALADAHECDAIAACDFRVLKVLLPNKRIKDVDTKGSGLTINSFLGNTFYTPKGRKVVIIPPLRQLVTVPHVPFLFHRFLLKLSPDHQFLKLPDREPIMVNTLEDMRETEAALASEPLISFDIETTAKQKITHISFSSLTADYSYQITDMVALDSVRKILLNDSMKIAQNGKYDCLHLIHWSAPIKNYYWDTYGLMACWQAELPRSLDFIGAFMLDDIWYWKDESSVDMRFYNARDTLVTLYSFLALINEMPEWALSNYVKKFPITFPHLASEFQGIAVDRSELASMTLKHRAIAKENLDSLNACLGETTFNPGSPKQVQSLLSLLSPKEKPRGSDVAALKHSASRHPLNSFLVDKIIAYRESKKLHTTYLDATLWHDRVTYSLDAFGTETGRSACRASSFGEPIRQRKDGSWVWESYGIQIQNIPYTFKKCLIADPGFLLVEMDKSQAESRCTAYLSQDPALMEIVENSPDFHSANASAFFGIPFEELYEAATSTILNKPIRDLAKRVNHGSNYNMGVNVLIQTMGESNLWNAKTLLGLPGNYNLKQIAQHLLDAFDKTYPRVRSLSAGWYGELVAEWKLRKGLITTPDGWTRKFYGDPTKSKPALNQLVAHSPQHLSVSLVDDGYFRIWYELDNPKTFRICGQIHDSVLFQVHKDHQRLIQKAKEIYDSTSEIIVHGHKMFIPSDIDGPKKYWE